MYTRTHICFICGAIRRRAMAREEYQRERPTKPPMCCGKLMGSVWKAAAEAAGKLSKAERVRWIELGALVFRRSGRRWMPALTAGERAHAKEQLASYRAGVEPSPLVWSNEARDG